jgi:hypothetical protein
VARTDGGGGRTGVGPLDTGDEARMI